MEGPKYLVTEHELQVIKDLCESLALALEKVIRRKQIIYPDSRYHPAIDAFTFMVEEILEETEKEKIMRIF